MDGQAFDFIHPQYGRLRVINTVDGLFYYLRDVMRIYGKSGKNVFETIADSNGRVAEFMIVMAPKGKDQKRESFLADDEMGFCGRRQKNCNAFPVFIDAETLHDLEQGLNAEQKLGKRWIHEFVEPVLADTALVDQYCSLGVDYVSCPPPTFAPMDIRYSDYGGLRINNCCLPK